MLNFEKWHRGLAGVEVKYRQGTADNAWAADELLDVVLDHEVIEHGDNLHQFVSNCAARLKPGGIMIDAMLNRSSCVLVLAVLGGEYVVRWLPEGLHDRRPFLKPREIETIRGCAELVIENTGGVSTNSASQKWKITANPSVNYMLVAEKRERPHPLGE